MEKKRFGIFFSTSSYAIAAAIIQFFTFILLGRSLGADNYSIILFSAVFVVIFVEFLGPGIGDFTIKNKVSESSGIGDIVSDSLLSILLTFPIVIFIAAVILMNVDFPNVSFQVILILFGSELISTKSLSYFEHVNVSIQKFSSINTFKLFVAMLKFITAFIYFILLSADDISVWIYIQSFLSITVSFFVWCYFYILFKFQFKLSFSSYEFKDGLKFAATQFLRGLSSVTDRYVVENNFSKAEFSSYSVSFRLMQFSLIPLQTVLKIIYPGYFKAAKLSVRHCFSFAISQLKLVVPASMLSVFGLVFLSFYIDVILGESYLGIKDVLFNISFIPLFMAISYVFQDFMISIDSSAHRYLCQIFLITCLVGFFLFLDVINLAHYASLVTLSYFLASIFSFLIALKLRGKSDRAN